MSEYTLKNIINKSVEFSDKVNFAWHGGEPLLAGLDFYKKVIKLQNEIINNAKRKILIKNNIQTNATLLNAEFVNFFKNNNVKVSTSIDGFKEMHDVNRVYPNGGGTFDDVMISIKLLKENNFDIGLVGVLTKQSINKLDDIYYFFKNNISHARLNHFVCDGQGKNAENLQLTPKEYGLLMIKLFDLWFEDNKEPFIKLQDYYNVVESMFTGYNNVCSYSNCFGRFISINSKGEIYPCNRYVGLPEFNLGNINEVNSLEKVFNSKKFKNLAKRNEILQKSECKDCKWWQICMGGCPHVAYVATGSIFHKDYYCESRKTLFGHILNRLNKIDTEKA